MPLAKIQIWTISAHRFGKYGVSTRLSPWTMDIFYFGYICIVYNCIMFSGSNQFSCWIFVHAHCPCPFFPPTEFLFSTEFYEDIYSQKTLFQTHLFRWVHLSLYEVVPVRPLVRLSVGWSVRNPFFFQMPKMDNFLYENHRGSLTLTLLNVLNVLNVIIVLNVLKMPKDPSLACWAWFSY